jgi:hypothetical protein
MGFGYVKLEHVLKKMIFAMNIEIVQMAVMKMLIFAIVTYVD